ncbi:hypothetical protein AVEN_223177-1 [Araneus ventricosus]|uniref:Uncharacterized protein n=1 Tax=Araneus ventricosus TaxID=182803 RepID=A0A4Y2FUD3_ARAVE|nr:hypothetical protein AVEN_223177-1 [Araneus ventricosus]
MRRPESPVTDVSLILDQEYQDLPPGIDSILILGGKPLDIRNSLKPTRHRVKKSLDEGKRDLFPFFLKSGEVFIGIPCISAYKATLQIGPYSLHHVKVWGLAWSVKEGHMKAGGSLPDVLGSALRVIILLENETTTKKIACIRTHGILKNVLILTLIHDSLNPPQETHAKARDASPNHDISTPMLHCWNLVLGVETSALRTTNPLYPVRTKQHVFSFITPKDIFPLFLGPVLVLLRPFHKRLAILRRDHRFLDGAFYIQSSCLKLTPDSTNRGFWIWGVTNLACNFNSRQAGIDT